MSHQEIRDVTSYISAYAPLVGVLVAIGVASMQYYLQREQWKQNLFDKRFKVYTAVEEYLTSVVVSTADEAERSRKAKYYKRFVMETRQAAFLFGPEVVKFIDEALNLDRTLSAYAEGTDEWTDAILRAVDAVQVNLVEIFGPYLQLHYEQTLLERLKGRIDQWVDSVDSHYGRREA